MVPSLNSIKLKRINPLAISLMVIRPGSFSVVLAYTAYNGFAGLILGLVGGVIVITWKPAQMHAKTQ